MPNWKMSPTAAASSPLINPAAGNGIPFQYDQLSEAQQLLLDSDADTAGDILNYLRGDDSNEVQNGGFIQKS